LRTLDAVDAALAALVAVIVAEGGEWFSVGDPDEGCAVLPGSPPLTGRYPPAPLTTTERVVNGDPAARG